MCLLVADLPVVEGILEDHVALRGIAIRSEDELHSKIAIFHFSVEVRVLGRFFEGTDLKINAVYRFLCLLSPADHVAKFIHAIDQQTSVSFVVICCAEGHL